MASRNQDMKAAIILFLMIMTMTTIVMRPCREALAFHGGGVGPCDACHSMHGSAAGPGSGLLKGQDQSSVCLACHEQQGVVGPMAHQVSTAGVDMPPGVPPRQLSPGGDFGWLKKSYTWSVDAQTSGLSPGERHGHNIVALDHQYFADATNNTSPGGSYPAAVLACSSCHAPHGNYRRTADGSLVTSGQPVADSGSLASGPDPASGAAVGSYRLLAGTGYQPKYLAGAGMFVNAPPAAVAPDAYNRSEATTQTRVAYGAGMSEWCRNCHGQMHSEAAPGPSAFVHPSGSSAKIDGGTAAQYNAYVKAGDLSGLVTSAYLSLVPFEEGHTNYGLLKVHATSDGSYQNGPEGTSAQVMCLTCHRAHASGWDGALRWNGSTERIVSAGFYSQEGQLYQPFGQGRTEAEALRAYYDIPASIFAPDQEPLCGKCHAGGAP